MVGQFALGVAVTGPIVILTALSLRAVQATDATGQYRFGEYLALRLSTGLVSLLLIIVIVVSAGYRRETAWIALAIGVTKVIETISDIFYGLLQRHERMDCISKSLLFRGPLSLIVMGALVYATGTVLWGVIGLGAVCAAVLLLYDIPNGAHVLKAAGHPPTLAPQWNMDSLANLARSAFPLGLAALFISASASVPRLYVERYAGERDLGIFAAAAYLMLVGGMVVNAAGQSSSSRLAQHYAEGRMTAFHTLLLKLVALGAALGTTAIGLAWWFGRDILTALYGGEYAARPDVFVWIMVAAAISYIGSSLGYGITATRAFARFYLPYFMMMIITLAAAALLIPRAGITGAAWTLCVTAVMSCLAPLVIFRGLKNSR
jgi:O-antigen/teichoic acid export membrane protein